MPKQYQGKGNQAFIYLMYKANLSRSDIARMLNISLVTVTGYVNDPLLMRLRDISTLCGQLGVSIEQFVYCISRNKPKIKTSDQKWFMQGLELEGNKILKDSIDFNPNFKAPIVDSLQITLDQFMGLLPNKFRRSEAIEIGLNLNIHTRTIGRYLKVLVHSGKLVKLSREYGFYTKV